MGGVAAFRRAGGGYMVEEASREGVVGGEASGGEEAGREGEGQCSLLYERFAGT